ncbi:hypothetical protein TNCT_253631 [Trichonephila clavata]|uniref:BUD13 homolog n=1 Tax=Trichonephila clavata TaxID=2740835 RepID=A0A8X6GA12_TRICU|nr:hypothetical protein TNCT_253631 [Trichonephila clavata]
MLSKVTPLKFLNSLPWFFGILIEWNEFKLDAELSGRNAETIVRDRKTGKKRDLEEENQERLEKEKKLFEQQQKYAEWGKGIEQPESKKNKLSETCMKAQNH